MWLFNFKKTFESKSVKDVKTKAKKPINMQWISAWIRRFLVVSIVFAIFYFRSSIAANVTKASKNIARTLVKNVSSAMSKEPKKDSIWNVNILILWIWWKNHDWGYLTDSMMIASFNKKNSAITFLTIPRDLYVKYDWRRWSRINFVFANKFLKTRDWDKSAKAVEEKIEEITWVKINYYIVVDFSGFEKMIDSLWWITVDVPHNIYDPAYPWPNYSFSPFRISKWIQTLDWKTALKYARSRHWNAWWDFWRSARQEQTLRSIIKQISSSWVFLNPRKAKALYLEFTETVKTNFDFKTLLSFVPHVEKLRMSSYVLNSNCHSARSSWKTLQPWCFVYPWVRADFWWQAVLLPAWANSRNIEEYSKIKKFAFIVLSYPELRLEKSKIQILNWIPNSKIRRKYRYLKPIASDLAYELKNYWFNVVDVWNASKDFKKNIWYVYNKKHATEDLIGNFVWKVEYQTWSVNYKWKWFDISLIVWEEYINGK